ncbi:MAG: SdpI family protein [Aureispira sp.]|nr:SdpI family protein [Aureispira sp.]
MKNNTAKHLTSLPKELLLLLITIIPVVYLFIVWKELPEQVPIHWNFQGEVDQYGSKASLGWVVLLINVPIYLLMLFLPKIAAKQESIERMGKKYYRLRLILQLFLSALVFIILLVSSGATQIAIETLLGYSFIFFMLLFGNYMGSIRQNHFMGIRTPWTLENEEVWKKTHQLGGRLWIGGGLFGFIFLLFLPNNWVLMTVVALMIIPMILASIYSFVLFKKLKNTSI